MSMTASSSVPHTPRAEPTTVLPALLAAGAALAQAVQLVTPWSYRAVFQAVALRQGVDENLLHALAWHESGLNPSAVGAPNANGTRDYGLMQINERNFATLGLTADTWQDPTANVSAAATLLRQIRATGGLSIADMVSIYNAGTDAGASHGGQPRTLASGAYVNQPYVDDVLAKYRQVQLAAFAPLGAFA